MTTRLCCFSGTPVAQLREQYKAQRDPVGEHPYMVLTLSDVRPLVVAADALIAALDNPESPSFPTAEAAEAAAKANPGERCARPAEWEIHYGTDPYDVTDACSGHLGALLSDAPEHRIYPIHAEVGAMEG